MRKVEFALTVLIVYQQVEEISAAIDIIESAGAIVKRNVKLRRFSNEDDGMFNDVSSMYLCPDKDKLILIFHSADNTL